MSPRPNHLPAWQDFHDTVELADSELVGARFQFTYHCRGALKNHVASFDGIALLTGCQWGNTDHTVVLVPIDLKRINMRPGCTDPIHVVREFWIPDSSFPDGYRNRVIEEDLFPEPNTQSTYSTVVINALRGLSAYDLYIQQGGNLTLQQWLQIGGYSQEVMQTINNLVTNLRETLGLDIAQAIQTAHQAMVDAADRAAAQAQASAQSAQQAADSVQQAADLATEQATAQAQAAAQSAQASAQSAQDAADSVQQAADLATTQATAQAQAAAQSAQTAESEAQAAHAQAEASQQAADAAAADLAEARAKVAQILAAITGIDPSQSADDAIVAEAAQRAAADDELGREIDGVCEVLEYSAHGGGWSNVDLTELTHIHKTISSSGTWDESNAVDSVIIPIGDAQKIRITNDNNGNGVYALLSYPSLSTVYFSSQNSERNLLPAGESVEIANIAGDSLYLFVNLANSGTTRITGVDFFYPSTDRKSGRLDEIDDSISEIEGILDIQSREGGYIVADFSDYPILKKNITREFEWSDIKNIVKSCIIGLDGVTKVKLINNTSGNCVYVFLTRDDTTTLYPSSQNPTERSILQPGNPIEITVASDSKYLFVNYYNETPRLSAVQLYYDSLPGYSQRIELIEQRIRAIEDEYGIEENPVLTEKEWGANYNVRNIEKATWTWWFYPQLVIDSRVHNHIWVGYTDEDGFVGLINFNPSRYMGRKVALKWSDDANVGYAADDHNNPAVAMLSDGRMVCIYASGHEFDNNVYIRVADDARNMKFTSFSKVEFSGKTTYVQVMQYNGSTSTGESLFPPRKECEV